MKKKVFFRSLLGFHLGISIGYIISIIISICFGQGYYSPCAPGIIDATGSEINAVILQTILSGLVGSAFAGSSVIWEMDNWSIAKQTSIYFLITSIVMMPIAYLMNWMDHSIMGFVSYFGIFIIIFIIIWVIQYFILKSKIKKINSKLK